MSKAPIVAIQMDPLEKINPAGDSTLILGLEAQKRGFRLFCYTPEHLSFENGALHARGQFVEFFGHTQTPWYKAEREQVLNLSHANIVLMRQDPPFDMQYISATFMLEELGENVLVVNNPASVRNCPEKWFVNVFPEFLPPTLISADKEAIKAFFATHKELIIKPLYGFGGHSIFHIKEGSDNLESILENFFHHSNEPLVVQRFIPEIRQGDVRAIFADGQLLGAFSRVPADGDVRSNLRVGGTAKKVQLTTRQQIICDALGPELKARGLIFVGIDLIGDYLVEINNTCPTGLRQLNELYGMESEARIWDAIEARMKC